MNADVLFVDQSADIGGAELSLIDIARRRQGPHRICILAEGAFASRLRALGQPVVVLAAGGAGRIARGDGALGLARAVPDVAMLLPRLAAQACRHEVVYANTMKAFALAALSRPLYRRPLIWHLHDLLTPAHFGGALRRGSALLSRGAAACIIVNSVASADAYRRAGGGGRVEVVPNGIDPAPFEAIDPYVARERLLAETGLDPVRPIIGLFGRLARWKGQHILVEAMRSLPGAQAVLVGGALFGEGDYALGLQTEIANSDLGRRIRMLGFRDDLPALMKGVDIVVHSSIEAEPFGRVIVEGMLAGKPVIATRAGGALEILRHGETGMLVQPGDPRALVRALETLLSDPIGRSEMAARAHAAACRDFHVDAYAARIEQIIASVAARR